MAAAATRSTELSPCRIEDELQTDPQHGFLEVVGKRRERAGVVDRAERDLVVVGVARAPLDRYDVEPAVASDLEDHGRLLTGNGAPQPLLLDLSLNLPDVPGVREVRD